MDVRQCRTGASVTACEFAAAASVRCRTSTGAIVAGTWICFAASERISHRYENGVTLLTSNLSFDE